jgi:ferredoxin
MAKKAVAEVELVKEPTMAKESKTQKSEAEIKFNIPENHIDGRNGTCIYCGTLIKDCPFLSKK